MTGRLLIAVAMLLGLNAHAETIELKDSNTVVLRDVVTFTSIAKVELELMKKAEAGKDLILVLDTPGGSVDAGIELISFCKGLPVKVHTLTSFAASMGFQIAQNLNQRYVLPHGTYMSHRARGGFEGQFPGELITRLAFSLQSITDLDLVASKRMGLTLDQYRALIQDEYWVAGPHAEKAKVADSVVTARCDKTMTGTVEQTINTMFGPVVVTLSKCPLIGGVIAIKFDGKAATSAELQEYINAVYTDKPRAVQKYIKTGEFTKYQ